MLLRFVSVAVALSFSACFTPIPTLEGGLPVVRPGDAGTADAATDAGTTDAGGRTQDAGLQPSCVDRSPLAAFLRSRVDAADAGCVNCLLLVNKLGVDRLVTFDATLSLEAPVESGASDRSVVFLARQGGGRRLMAVDVATKAVVTVALLGSSDTISGRWVDDDFVFVQSAGGVHQLQRYSPDPGTVFVLASLPSGVRHPLQPAVGGLALSLESGIFVAFDGGLNAIDRRTDVTSLAGSPLRGVFAYSVADGGVFTSDRFGSALSSRLPARKVDIGPNEGLMLQRSATDLWRDAQGSAQEFYRSPRPIIDFEFEGSRTLVQHPCGRGFATVIVHADRPTQPEWLFTNDGWPFDTRDFGEGVHLQPTSGAGFVVQPERL